MTTVTVLSCIERGLGFLYRIYLSRTIGSEGMGLYQIALSVVGVLMTLSASGVPITVSRMMIRERTAGRERCVNSVVTAGIAVALAVCLPACIICYTFKGILAPVFPDDRCRLLFLIILPGVVLTSVYAVIRGFFWGNKSFYTYSIIELAEEAVMVVAGILLVSNAVGITQKAVGASIAVLISYVFSFTAAAVAFALMGGSLKNPAPSLKPLISASAPITLMRGATSLTSSLIAIILPSVLISAGLSRQEAVSGFGIISGMTLPLLFIPSTVIGSISLVLSPELSNDFYKRNLDGLKNNVERALILSSSVAMLVVPVFVGSGPYVGELLYGNATSGVYLRFAAFAMIPMSFCLISTSLLNAMGMERKTLLNYALGAIILLISVLILPRFIGNYGLIAGYFASYVVNGALNLVLLKKICCNKLDFFKKQIKALPIVIFCSALSYFSFELSAKIAFKPIALVFSCAITEVVLLLLFEIFGVISINEIIAAFFNKKSRKARKAKAAIKTNDLKAKKA